MNIRPCVFPAIFLATLPLAFAPGAAAQAASSDYIHLPAMRLLHWSHFPIQVYLEPGSLATKERKDAVTAGFDEWVHATGGYVKYQVVPSPTQANVTLAFLPDATIPGKDGATGNTRVTFSDTRLKSARLLVATGNAAPIDLQATAAHEFGHALGIDGHSDDPADIMYPTLLQSSPESALPPPVHVITRRDFNTLKACYPALAASPPPPAASAEASE